MASTDPVQLFGLPLPVLAAVVSTVLALVVGITGPAVQLHIGRKQAAAWHAVAVTS